MGEHKSGPYLNKKKTFFFERGVLQLRQPYIRMTGFLKEAPPLPCAVTSHANKGGHHGYAPKQIQITIVFAIDSFYRW